MRSIVLSLLFALTFGSLREAAGQTEMKMTVSDNHGRISQIDWLKGAWKDTKANERFRKLRIEIDKLPARNHKVDEDRLKSLIRQYRSNFKEKPSYETFFPWLYMCGRYRLLGYEYYGEIDRFLFQFKSPDCFEYARAAFIVVAEIDGTTLNFPKNFAKRFRPFAKGDWLLTEALIRHYIHSSKVDKDDLWWSWKEAKKLSETMPDGMYGFGRLRVDAANPLITSDMKFLAQEVAFIDFLLKGNYYNETDQKKLRNVKDFYLTVKKRIEDYKKKHPGG